MTDQTQQAVEALRRAGGQLANCAFNLAQRDDLPANIRETLNSSRREYDAAAYALTNALAAAPAVGAPVAYAAFLKREFGEGLGQDRASLSIGNVSRAFCAGWEAGKHDPTAEIVLTEIRTMLNGSGLWPIEQTTQECIRSLISKAYPPAASLREQEDALNLLRLIREDDFLSDDRRARIDVLLDAQRLGREKDKP